MDVLLSLLASLVSQGQGLGQRVSAYSALSFAQTVCRFLYWFGTTCFCTTCFCIQCIVICTNCLQIFVLVWDNVFLHNVFLHTVHCHLHKLSADFCTGLGQRVSAYSALSSAQTVCRLLYWFRTTCFCIQCIVICTNCLQIFVMLLQSSSKHHSSSVFRAAYLLTSFVVLITNIMDINANINTKRSASCSLLHFQLILFSVLLFIINNFSYYFGQLLSPCQTASMGPYE